MGLFGVNVAGAEFAEGTLPGTIDVTYTYAADPQRYIDFVAQGQVLFRIPFLWERIQRTALGALSAPDLAGVHAMVRAATQAGGKVILELHNYARYNGTPMVAGDAAKFSDVWSRLATQFRWHPGVYGYEIMNEPHDLANGTIWPTLAQAATNAIRAVDTKTKIIVGGDDWSTAAFWRDNNEDLAITDPTGNLIYAAHQYFDPDHSGTYAAAYSTYPYIGIERVQPFVAWLQAHGQQGILTEYGVPPTADWTTVLDYFMLYISGIPEIVGGTAWAAGPWWGDYALSLEYPAIPTNPQMAVLARYPTARGSG